VAGFRFLKLGETCDMLKFQFIIIVNTT